MLRRHSFNLQYSEGLYVVQLEEGGQINHYFMDEDFRLVLGPYPDAQPFSEGYAAVQISKYKSTYIDKKGNPLPDTYTNCEPFRNGCAIVESYAGRYSMIDTEGTVIATLSSWPFPFSDGYYYVRDYEDVVDPTSFHGYRTAEVIRCYNSRGRELWSEFDGDILSPDLVFHSYYGSGSLLKNVSLGTFVEVFESHPSLVGPATEPFVVLRFRNSYFGYRIFTKELMELPYDRSFDPTISRWQTGSIEDTALALPHKNGSRIYTTPNDAIGVYPVWEFRQGILYSDNTVAFTDSSYTKLYDADGKLFFSYPLILLGD